MKYFEKVPALLLLEDGTWFKGLSAGKIGTVGGEVCFNTGMTGYQEVFTDPSYAGQILVMTNAHIGNYGALSTEVESDSVKISGLVTKNLTNLFSRKRATSSIQEYLLQENVIAISDVDTRALVRHIRTKGAMNALIASGELAEQAFAGTSNGQPDLTTLKRALRQVPDMSGQELASGVSTSKSYVMGDKKAKFKVAALDLGIKKNILRNLLARGCCVKVFPAKTPVKEIQKWQPDGYFISNGPGDPAAMDYAVKTVREILQQDIPLFGICLGHQVLALACGIKTYKMHHGHRGINHPVQNLLTGKCEITTQNHGFGVSEEAIAAHEEVEITHRNLNDNSVEGIRLRHKKAFSVQYHPEAAPGPHDSRYLFEAFIRLMEGEPAFHKDAAPAAAK